MDSNDHLLVLAHGVVTMSDTLDTLRQAEEVGVPVGYSLIGTIRGRLRSLASQWWTTTHGEPVWHDIHTREAVHECREWVTTHGVRLTELREQEQGV